MRKSTIKSLLLGLLMTAGASSAWADGSKRVLNSQDYETATAADWTSPSGIVSFKTGDATYGNYARVDVNGTGNRSCYKYVSYDYEPDGYTSAEMTTIPTSNPKKPYSLMWLRILLSKTASRQEKAVIR